MSNSIISIITDLKAQTRTVLVGGYLYNKADDKSDIAAYTGPIDRNAWDIASGGEKLTKSEALELFPRFVIYGYRK